MRKTRIVIALALLSAAPLAAQGNHDHTVPAAPCPLHLKTLGLTPEQSAVFDSVRALHKAGMKGAMPDHDMRSGNHKMTMSDSGRARMKESMAVALAAVRGILTDAQVAIFDAAVIAHKARMDNPKSKEDECMACCMECMGHDHVLRPRE
jgi:hypothetical protein